MHHLAIHKTDDTEAHYDFDKWSDMLHLLHRLQVDECRGVMVVFGNDTPEPKLFEATTDGQMKLTDEGEVALGNDGAKPL